MDPIFKCFETLKVLILSADSSGVALAEHAVDKFLALSETDEGKLGLLHNLQSGLYDFAKPESSAQIEFLNLVLDYTEKHQRFIQERHASQTS